MQSIQYALVQYLRLLEGKTMNILFVHGGGPTPVINSSLYGGVTEAKKQGFNKILGAIGWIDGIINERFVDFNDIGEDELKLLLKTPASALGTVRGFVTQEMIEQSVNILVKNRIDVLVINGGNGTMDVADMLYKKCKDKRITVVGIPKTIDNDLSITDHTPGFASAARYVAGTVSEIARDVISMPIHVSIIEIMGRNAGWLAGASVLSKECGEGVDLIYLPEIPFNENEFLHDVKQIYDRQGYAIVVVSEGLVNKKGEPICEPIYKTELATYFGDVGTHLAEMVIKKLGIKARSEKPGIASRASVKWLSEIDVEEAKDQGAYAVLAALRGENGVMSALKRVSNSPYKCEIISVPFDQVGGRERKVPRNMINEKGNGVTKEFIEYIKPLVGEMPKYINLKGRLK